MSFLLPHDYLKAISVEVFIVSVFLLQILEKSDSMLLLLAVTLRGMREDGNLNGVVLVGFESSFLLCKQFLIIPFCCIMWHTGKKMSVMTESCHVPCQ